MTTIVRNHDGTSPRQAVEPGAEQPAEQAVEPVAARFAEGLDNTEALDRAAGPLQRAVRSALGERTDLKDLLQGRWLGHPAHPMLTDLPIGFWTSAFVLDLVGGKRSRRAAGVLTALGVVSAVPTAATGLADWSEFDGPKRRSGVVHAAANATATGLYALSVVARLRGRHGRGVLLGFAGAAAATVGGYLGGHLAFGGEPEGS